MSSTRLHETVAAVCPIEGLSVGAEGQSATVRFRPTAAATNPQKAAAQAAIDTYDWSDAAQQAWEDAQQPERTAIRQQAANAIAANNTYSAAADTGTAAQIQARDHAQVKALTQQSNAIIKRIVQLG